MKVDVTGFGEMPAVNLGSAPLRHAREFQKQSGLKLSEIQKEIEDAGEALGIAVVAFLSLHAAGHREVTWEQILDTPTDQVKFVEEAQDRRQREEAEAEAGEETPTRARTDSPSDDSAPGPASS